MTTFFKPRKYEKVRVKNEEEIKGTILRFQISQTPALLAISEAL